MFIFKRFIEGGWVTMSLLTIDLLLLVVAIFKASHLVRKLGALALGIALATTSVDMMTMFDMIQAAGGISPEGITRAALYGGLKVVLIPVFYAALIYTISVVADIVASMKKKK
jgi:hypothetical protein